MILADIFPVCAALNNAYVVRDMQWWGGGGWYV